MIDFRPVKICQNPFYFLRVGDLIQITIENHILPAAVYECPGHRIFLKGVPCMRGVSHRILYHLMDDLVFKLPEHLSVFFKEKRLL